MTRRLLRLAALLVATGCGWATTPPASAGTLRPGEQARSAAGFAFVTRFIKAADADAPLVVFMPGRNSLARIADGGRDGGLPQDFLAHSLRREGDNFLGVSSPVEASDGPFDAAQPDFTIRAWGRGAAELTQAIQREQGLTGRVVLAVWSMGGRSVQPFAEAANALGLDVDFAVSLSATPPIPGTSDSDSPQMSPSGLAAMPAGARVGVAQTARADRMNGRTAIEPKVLASQYLGHTPVQLIGRGLRYDRAAKRFVDDPWADMQDSKFDDIDRFPIVATIVPNTQGDSRHALTDQASRGFCVSHKIFSGIAGGSPAIAKLPVERFRALRGELSKALGTDGK